VSDNAPVADTDPNDEWLPLDANPHADDKRDVLDPSGEGQPFRRLIQVALGVGVLVVILVVWLVLL
jgi:hypothetical protein